MEELKNTQASPEQIAEWTARYGKIKKIVLRGDDEDEPQIFYFKKIDLRVLRLAQNAISQEKDSIKYAEIVLQNTILNNKELLQDSEVFLGLLPIVDKLITSKIATIEKN